MTDKCEDCGQIPPQTKHEKTMNHLRLVEDEMVLGHSLECGTCGTRIDPIEAKEQENGEVKFLEEGTLGHGME